MYQKRYRNSGKLLPESYAAEIRLWENLEVGDEIIIQGKKQDRSSMKVGSMQVRWKKYR